jgi:hypothetical protein
VKLVKINKKIVLFVEKIPIQINHLNASVLKINLTIYQKKITSVLTVKINVKLV